jgi:cytochrome oxidase assembly protein ShyY1
MKIRVIRSFRGYKRGQEFDWDSGFAKILVARGFVVEVRDSPPETATAEVAAERAIVSHKPKRRPA